VRCAFGSKHLNAVVIDLSIAYRDLEICCCDILHSGAKCRLFVVYKPPSSDNMLHLLECIDWVTLTAPSGGPQEALINFAIENGFLPLVQHPTRGVNLLDLLFSNDLLLCVIFLSNIRLVTATIAM